MKNPQCKTVVVKIASRCNLNCSYCYMYNLGDMTYRNQPKVMSKNVIKKLVTRVKNHCKKYQIKEFRFIFHGGEPLLAGPDFFTYFVNEATSQLVPDINPVFLLQTNGTLINNDWCELFSKLSVSIGISLDGDKLINDKHRVYHSGKGSYDDVVRGLRCAQDNKSLKYKPSLLSVLNINADPIETYEHLKKLEVNQIEFLLPDHNYDNLPPAIKNPYHSTPEAPYADWLISIFDHWFYDTEKKPNVRIFDTIILSILGLDPGLDSLGNSFNEVLVIETNGGIEAVDSLKICGNGFTKADANVLNNEFDEALQSDLASLYYYSHKKLSRTCQQCPIKDICGGGYLANRYSSHNGFNNPSVYCKDLLKLITYIQNKVLNDIGEEKSSELGLETVSYETALQLINDGLNHSLIFDNSLTSELEAFKKQPLIAN